MGFISLTANEAISFEMLGKMFGVSLSTTYTSLVQLVLPAEGLRYNGVDFYFERGIVIHLLSKKR